MSKLLPSGNTQSSFIYMTKEDWDDIKKWAKDDDDGFIPVEKRPELPSLIKRWMDAFFARKT